MNPKPSLAGKSRSLEEMNRKIHEILTQMFYTRGGGRRNAEILAWLFVQDQWTQEELAQQSRYSKGSISTALRELEKTQLVKKQKRNFPGGWEYVYRLAGGINDLNRQNFVQGRGFIQGMALFLQQLKENILTQIVTQSPPREDNLPHLLQNFACDLLEAIQMYGSLNETIAQLLAKQSKNDIPQNPEIPPIMQKATKILQKCTTFEDAQKCIIETFGKVLPELRNRDPIASKCAVAMYIHRELTQAGVRLVTGLSAGAVSQGLQQLTAMGVVSEGFIPRTHKKVYHVGNLLDSFVSVITGLQEETRNWVTQLNVIAQELRVNKPEWHEITGYTRLVEVTREVVQAIEVVPKMQAWMRSQLGLVGKK